jgi:cell fate regulator YaaT (PSP1 superfamily)
LKKLARIHEMEKEAQKKFNEALKTQPFNMHLIDVEYQFDGNKLTFYFIAESRIDFRDFLKDLARIFRTRIELRQISEQQEIERLGGIGPCGREFCCKSLHLNFGRVTTQVIKDQNITAATSKITGPCGRLLCCMAYEEEFYKEKAKEFPNLDDEVIYHDKRMKVTKNNYLVSTVELKDENEVRATISLAEYNMMKMKKERKISKFSSIIGHHKTKVRK